MVNRSVTLTKKINLDFGIESNQTQFLNAIKGLNSLTNDEKNAIQLVTKIGLITKDGLAVKVKLHNLTSKIVTFTVKREFTSAEKANVDIELVKKELDKVAGDNLIIKLPIGTTGNIIANNQDKITKELRKMITKDNTGAANHDSIKGVTISVSMSTDSQITTTAQKIIINLSKRYGTSLQINAKFQGRRELTSIEKNNADIHSIKAILNAKDGNALTIFLPSDTTGNIIHDNKVKIEKQLRKMITKDDTGAANHDAMKGVIISVSMSTDSQITTTARKITVTLSKCYADPITIRKFRVQKDWTPHEASQAMYRKWQKLIAKARSVPENSIDLIIKIPNKIWDNNSLVINYIKKELRKIITGEDVGAADDPLMEGVQLSLYFINKSTLESTPVPTISKYFLIKITHPRTTNSISIDRRFKYVKAS